MRVRELLDLTGKTALITGGSRGLGLQMAEALGEMGAQIAITARKAEELADAVRTLEAAGIEAAAFPADIGKADAAARLVDAVIAHYGKVDILVNNAGAAWNAPAETYPVEAWNKLINLNLSGPFLLAQQVAVRCMIPGNWGRIINIASIAGLTASDPRVVKTVGYNATKHGLVGLTRQLAAEWGEHNIVVNAICPGYFPSRMTRAMLDAGESIVLETTPTKRLGGENDLKGIVVLLASDAARHITGQAIAVDGGATIL